MVTVLLSHKVNINFQMPNFKSISFPTFGWKEPRIYIKTFISHEHLHHSLFHPLATMRHRTWRGGYEILAHPQNFISEIKGTRWNPTPLLTLL